MKADRYVWTLAVALTAGVIAGPSVAEQGLETATPTQPASAETATPTESAPAETVTPGVIVQAATTSGPADRVDVLHAELVAVMRNASQLGFRGRYDRLAQVLPRVFNLPLMARTATGNYWSELTDDQKHQVINEFTKMTIATYADRFDGFNGERFETLQTEDARRGHKMVKSRIVTGKGDIIKIDYLMRLAQKQWRIVDVFLKGAISELATRRSEYQSVLKRDGINGLLSELRSKTATLSISN